MPKKFTKYKKKEIINDISNYYDSKFVKYGSDLKTIGWSNKDDQQLRFSYLLKNINLKNKSILDVGCGFGDLSKFISKKTRSNFRYLGIDISRNIINYAKNNNKKKNIIFKHSDLDSLRERRFDICVASGSLSYNHSHNKKFTEDYIKKMFQISKYAVCVNFLSDYSDFTVSKNAHYSPEKIFKFAKNLSSKVNLYHDYPLYEFTIQIYK